MSTVSKDVAEAEFARFIEANALLVETPGMSDEDRASFAEQKTRITRAMEQGALMINDQGEPVFTPQRTKDAEALTFHEPTGASLMAMDRRKRGEDIAKLYSTMADMTRTDAKVFSKMAMADLKVCMAVTALFLA